MKGNEQRVLEEFYVFCLSTCSECRLVKIKNVLMKAREIIGKDLTSLVVSDVVSFLSYINQSSYKEWTKNDFKKIFKRFLKFTYRDLEMIDGALVKDGFRGVSKRRAFNKEKINKNTLLKPKELETLIRVSSSLRLRALFSFMYESAFRPCEIRSLKWKDLVFDDSLGICRVWVISPKTKEARSVPVKDCVLHLKRWRDEYSFPNRSKDYYVFPSKSSPVEPMASSYIAYTLRAVCKKADLRPLFPYLFRHSRLLELHKLLPDKLSSKFAGHSIETSEIYNHLSDDDLESSMLQNVYVTEELTPSEKKEIEVLRADLSKHKTMLRKLIKQHKELYALVSP